jgi:Rab GDP dissociation inhibitor
MVSSAHNVCAKGFFIATCSTTVETATPNDELKAALNLLGPILDIHYRVSPLYVPTDDGQESKVSSQC